MRPRKDWQSLEEIVGSALKELEPFISEWPVQLKLPRDLPLIRCDAVLIARVLVNLLDNALKYTPPGTPIGISVSQATGAIRIEVWDEGPGLPAGQEQAIFQRFARGERESAIPGVGLGLAISQAIVEAHGGRIWAENREGRGSRFIFTLPLEQQPALAADPNDEAEGEPRSRLKAPF
jgi:two-component system sensor histidine kinase KdpD